jgi:hypothetical protein
MSGRNDHLFATWSYSSPLPFPKTAILLPSTETAAWPNLASDISAIWCHLFDLGSNGLVLTSHVLAGIKLVIAGAFLAYVIEFARSLVVAREADYAPDMI